MAFHDAATPEDLPLSHQGEWWEPPCEVGDDEIDEPSEITDTALTTWLDARQPNLEPEDDR